MYVCVSSNSKWGVSYSPWFHPRMKRIYSWFPEAENPLSIFLLCPWTALPPDRTFQMPWFLNSFCFNSIPSTCGCRKASSYLLRTSWCNAPLSVCLSTVGVWRQSPCNAVRHGDATIFSHHLLPCRMGACVFEVKVWTGMLFSLTPKKKKNASEYS